MVIVNDGGYGQIRDEMRGRGVEPLGVDLRVPDFVEVARGLGAFAARADGLESLRSLLAEGLARGGVTVIEYPLPS